MLKIGGVRQAWWAGIARSAEGSCSEGWRYSDDQRQIRLCPSTCARVQAGQGRVTSQFGCITTVR